MTIPFCPNHLPLVAIDPGGMTGVVVVKGGNIVAAATLTHHQMFQALESKLLFQCVKNWVVESFLLYPWKAKDQAFSDLQPARLIGAIEYAAWEWGASIKFQTARQAKDFPSEKFLQQYGWNSRLHTKHEKDAARHAICAIMIAAT